MTSRRLAGGLAAVVAAGTLVACSSGGAGPAAVETPSAPTAQADRPLVVLVSIDGFRADYLDWYQPETILSLARDGVRAASLVPAFPTKTFPNHFTIVTGLYPAHHGILANNIYDPEFDATYTLRNRKEVADGRWYEGEPVWIAAERQGLRTAPVFWPGSEAEIRGLRPTYWRPYDDEVPAAERVDRLLALLDQPAPERPSFLTLYLSDLDHAGHRYGPRSGEVAATVARLDAELGRLLQGFEERGLSERVNLLLTSDHGMAATSHERAIALDRYLDPKTVKIDESNPVSMIWARGVSVDRLVEQLAPIEHLEVYRREEVPPELHFDGNRRIPDVIAIAEEGWSLTNSRVLEHAPERLDGGNHGYRPESSSMQALFVARGPNFRRGLETGPIPNVDLYEVLCALLRITPEANDGSPATARGILVGLD